MRTSASNGTVTDLYVYTGGQLTMMRKNGVNLYFTYDAEGSPLTLTYGSATYYFVTNLQGDVIALMNVSGLKVVEYTYDAWGNPLTVTGSLASTLGQYNPLRYRGYVYDVDTGLYYLQSRYYNPEIGRFINADGYTSTGQGLLGNNMFAYCLNNPIMFHDPQGSVAIVDDLAYLYYLVELLGVAASIPMFASLAEYLTKLLSDVDWGDFLVQPGMGSLIASYSESMTMAGVSAATVGILEARKKKQEKARKNEADPYARPNQKNRDEREKQNPDSMRTGYQGQNQDRQKNIRPEEGIGSGYMHIWTLDNWKNNLHDGHNRRTGLRLKFDAGISMELRIACKEFAAWLRHEYYFPLRVPVYIKKNTQLTTRDGEMAIGTFFEPNDFSVEPYIRIAAGDYDDLVKKRGRDNAIASILNSIAHELTHYFQWINGIALTEVGYERQAKMYAKYIVYEYSETRDHP